MRDEAPCTVFGPVESWSLGKTITVDMLFVHPMCSFRCLYCELSRVSEMVVERHVFVPTRIVLEDVERSAWRHVDAIAFTGSGEPTLAANLGEAIDGVKKITGKRTVVVTNSSTLFDRNVRADLCRADHVCCKLDAGDETSFQSINRPAAGLTLAFVAENIAQFASEYEGYLSIQVMTRPMRHVELEKLARILQRIEPDEVYLNTPLTRVPTRWRAPASGHRHEVHTESYPEHEELLDLELSLRQMTGLRVRSSCSENQHTA